MARKTYVFQTNPDGSYAYPLHMVEKKDQLYPYNGTARQMGRPNHFVMGDTPDYQSTITGETIHGRAHHRQHLREHGCVEIGCDTPDSAQKYFKPKELTRKDRIEDVKRVYEHLESNG